MTEHTPGPWRLTEDRYNIGDREIVSVYTDHGSAWLFGPDDEPIIDFQQWDGDSEAYYIFKDADAFLIAAVPDLLAALESVEWIGGQGSTGQFCPFCRGTWPDHKLDCVRQAAIAKARGER